MMITILRKLLKEYIDSIVDAFFRLITIIFGMKINHTRAFVLRRMTNRAFLRIKYF